MNRALGIARCGLACCLCSESKTCLGCHSDGCKDREWCENRRCSIEKGFAGCFECPDTECLKGLLQKIKPRVFCNYLRLCGMDALLNRLDENDRAGVIYHRSGINGDYDDFDSEEALIAFIQTGKR